MIVAGNPGVPRDNLYPTRTKPIPIYTGMVSAGMGRGLEGFLLSQRVGGQQQVIG